MIEACEESGSYDLPCYLEAAAPRIGGVDFVVVPRFRAAATTNGCGSTTSLRGLAGGTLTVEVLTEGVHSGDARGVVPSSFRIARRLLDRLEDAATGPHQPAEFHVADPAGARRAGERGGGNHGRHVIASIRSPERRSRW